MAIPKRTGGKYFLQQEVGTLVNYTIHQHNGVSEATSRPYTRLSIELGIQREAANEMNKQFLHAGYLQPGLSVSEDGKSFLGTDMYAIDPATEWGAFVTSLFEDPSGGEKKQRLPEELYGTGTNYEAWMGTKCLLDRVVDKAATEKRGPEINKTTGQSYDRRQLLCLEVLALPTATGKSKRGKAGPVMTPKLVPAAPAPALNENDTDALDAVLTATLANVPNTVINRKGLGTAFLKYSSKLGQTGAARDIPRKVFASDEYLLGAVDRGVIDYDGTDDGAITLLRVGATA